MNTALTQKFPFILDRNLEKGQRFRKSRLHVLWYSIPRIAFIKQTCEVPDKIMYQDYKEKYQKRKNLGKKGKWMKIRIAYMGNLFHFNYHHINACCRYWESFLKVDDNFYRLTIQLTFTSPIMIKELLFPSKKQTFTACFPIKNKPLQLVSLLKTNLYSLFPY